MDHFSETAESPEVTWAFDNKSLAVASKLCLFLVLLSATASR